MMRTALPIAHKSSTGSGSLSYEDYYLEVLPGEEYVTRLGLYRVFNQRYTEDGDQRVCPGLYLGLDDLDSETGPGDGRIDPIERWEFSDGQADLLNLHAVTDGFLSWDGGRLVLRLPRELEHIGFSEDVNSGELLYDVPPEGPNLRYVVYDFDVENPDLGAVETTIKSKLRPLLEDANHPMRTALNVQITEEGDDGSTTTQNVDLGTYLSTGDTATRIDEVLDGFVDGELSLLVAAGDVVGSLEDTGEVMIEFRDSCGSYQPGSFGYHSDDAGDPGEPPDRVDSTFRPSELRRPIGRRLNPSYFLWVLASRPNRNGNHVDLRTDLSATFDPGGPAHPLLHLLDAVPAEYDYAQLDLTADTAPRPRNFTVPIDDDDGDVGVPIGALSEWHESRNASDPYDTNAAVEWRVYGDGYTDNAGNQVTDGTDADVGKFRSQRKPGTPAGNMPAGYNPDFPPGSDERDAVSSYWADYGALINPLAERFDMPCELIVALSCKESSGGHWADADRESIVACEPIPAGALPVANVAANPYDNIPNPFAGRTDQQLLTDYDNYVGRGTTNPNPIPIPWNGGVAIDGGTALTWEELAYLHAKFADNVRYTPGVIQIQPTVATGVIGQMEGYYGDPLFDGIDATVELGGVDHNLTVQDPADDLRTIASNWFGVDHGGANANLTRKHRAFHSLAAGVAKMRRDYNQSVDDFNLITDFDPPTVAAAHNAGAEHRAFNANQWDHIFGLNFHSGAYPQDFPEYYNAAVELFNGEWDSMSGRPLPAPNPTPTVRLRRSL